MITGKEYLKKNMENTNIPEEHYENEIGEMMEWYAYDYHQEQVKNLTIPDVRQQSELLKAFLKYRLDKPHSDFQTQDYDIEQFLKDFNVC